MNCLFKGKLLEVAYDKEVEDKGDHRVDRHDDVEGAQSAGHLVGLRGDGAQVVHRAVEEGRTPAEHQEEPEEEGDVDHKAIVFRSLAGHRESRHKADEGSDARDGGEGNDGPHHAEEGQHAEVCDAVGLQRDEQQLDVDHEREHQAAVDDDLLALRGVPRVVPGAQLERRNQDEARTSEDGQVPELVVDERAADAQVGQRQALDHEADQRAVELLFRGLPLVGLLDLVPLAGERRLLPGEDLQYKSRQVERARRYAEHVEELLHPIADDVHAQVQSEESSEEAPPAPLMIALYQ